MAEAIKNSREPFGRALGELLRARGYTDSMGNPNLHSFVQDTGISLSYESLRRTVAGERPVTPGVMEEVADALGIKPEHFAEYRIVQAHKQFDVREVGFEAALGNLEKWAQETAGASGRRRRRA